ncbi:HD domain-containing protein [Microaerobacter geothermalis]|uniref:HD domain-containing protein n=1 Tax=Microaerobacter geothermalis TaxID=674972 RepID=UPI001F29A72B|nr:HD domain-containing protein [Microaerobacter geothermalis]MCF6092840.1 HD domain-containing protein [Microaerobacter geothermalis]
MKVFRDPVHNIIQFDKQDERLIIDLLDTPEFQRLRHIRQLGFSFLTYPGAEHSRFSHSLGVIHVMKRFIEKLSRSKEKDAKRFVEEINDQRMLALVAALLHDIGHGPFSHALERITKVRHERWTVKIITGDTMVKEVLESYRTGFSEEVAEVIRRTHSSKAVVKLLSSQLDTDRIDYLLRDSKLTGAGYGTFDLEWLINSLRLGSINGEMEVGLDLDKGKSIAEDFVMARYYMYVNVYFHKTTRSAELLVEKIFERVSELKTGGVPVEIPDDLQQLLEMGLSDEGLFHYLKLDDHIIWYFLSRWAKHDDPILSDLSKRLLNRKLYKIILRSMDWFTLMELAKNAEKSHGIPQKYLLLRDEISSSSYKDTYIMHKPHDFEGPQEQEASEQIFLFDEEGKEYELSQVSDVIKTIRNKQIIREGYYVPEYLRDAILEVD